MHHSNLSKLQKRFGIKGIEAIEDVIFNLLKIAKVIDLIVANLPFRNTLVSQDDKCVSKTKHCY